jgi:hypothetical protein
MRAIKIETVDGKTIITTEEVVEKEKTIWRLFRKPVIVPAVVKHCRYMAADRIAGNFWRWLELPDKKLVGDSKSFQLDAWREHGI